jgi:ubiquinone/menaquinone biosynthesis C-methylase UbiE
MATESAYEISSIPGGVDREVERLRDQALTTWPKEARILGWWGLRDGMSVMDVGAGPGFITSELYDTLPSSNVTALEIDPVMIDRARQYLAGKEGDRLTIIQGSVMDTHLPDDSFDFAIARYLFQHLPDPVGAASEMLRILKPGGKLVVLDIDDAEHLWQPDFPPDLKVANERFYEEHRAKGGDRFVGRKLVRILQRAGFRNCTMEAIVIHSDEVGIDFMAPQISPETFKGELEEGKISQQEFDMMVEHNKLLRGPDGIVMLLIFIVCGEK